METLKRLRKERGLRQIDVANVLGITVSAYGNYELEQRKPDIDTLNKLADFFGVSVDYLLGRETTAEHTPTNATSLQIPEKYKDIALAFNSGADNLTPEDIQDVVKYIEFVKSKKNK